MKKFRYFLWYDSQIGYGRSAETLVYINANNEKEAKEKLMQSFGFKNNPHFINGDVEEVKEFIQPKPIPII